MSEESGHRGLGFRPTEYVRLSEPTDAVLERLRAGIEGHGAGLDARWAGEHLMFSLAPEARQAWSPWLSVALRDEPDRGTGTTMVVAQFCPHPQLWTAVMLGNVALLTILVLAGGFGWAQLALQRPAWAFWVAGGAAVGMLGLWLGGQLGQRLARAQMHELWTILTSALGSPAGRN